MRFKGVVRIWGLYTTLTKAKKLWSIALSKDKGIWASRGLHFRQVARKCMGEETNGK